MSFTFRKFTGFCTNTSLLTLLLVALACTGVRAQDVCPDDVCGDIPASFAAANMEIVFCEGATVILENTSAPGLDFFILDWQDGAIDTVYDYSNISHVYTLPDGEDGECKEPRSFGIEFRGVKQCNDGFSCQSGRLDFTIRPRPQARMIVPTEVCSGRELTFMDNSCNANNWRWDFGDGSPISTEENPTHTYASPGVYVVTLTVDGISSCSSLNTSTSQTVEIVTPPNALFDLDDDDLVACRGTEITFINRSNEDTNIQWNISPGSAGGSNWSFIDTSMNAFSDTIVIRFEETRTFNIELVGSNACDTERSEVDIVIEDAPTVNLLPMIGACDQVSLTPADLDYEVTGSTTDICWRFTNGSLADVCTEDFGSIDFTESGTVELVVTSLCGETVRRTDVIIQSSEIPMLTGLSQYCSGNDPDTLRANIPGGVWIGDGIIDDVLGLFDPGDAEIGDNVITYRIDNGLCVNENTITLNVVESETVTATDASFCIDGDPADLSAIPGGGTWSGTGITDANTGTFDPDSSDVGMFFPDYTYVDGNGCVVTVSPEVNVIPLPTATTTDTAIACFVNEDVELIGITEANPVPDDGNFVWTLNGTELPGGTFNPESDLPGPGVYDLTFTYESGPCMIAGATKLNVIENPVLMLDPQDNVCISEGTLQLSANLSGGMWSGPGVDPATGEVDLMVAGGGDHTYNYTFQPGGSCEQTTSQNVTVEDPGSSIEAGGDQEACEGNDLMLTLTGSSPAGGMWSGPGVTDPVAGTVDLDSLVPGADYEFIYSVSSATTPGCDAAAMKTVSYYPRPVIDFAMAGAPCINEEFCLSVPAVAGNSVSWGFGDGTMGTGADICHTYTAGGNYDLTLRVTSARGCFADTTVSIYVTTPPVPSFALDSSMGCAPFVLDLEDESTGDQLTSVWIVNNDTFPGGQNLNYTIDGFFADTTIDIALIAENFCGARPQVQSVLVRPYPTVNFGLDLDEDCSPFTPRISNVTRGNPVSWRWDMGNGTTGTDSIPPPATYTTPDDSVSTYEIMLIATNDCGRDTMTRTVTVYPPDVEAFIGLDTIAGCQPWTFQPESFSTPGSALAWEVTNSAGAVVATGNNATPNFQLDESGTYRVVLQAARCGEDADTVFVEVLPAPEVSFVADMPRICEGELLQLTNTSVGISGGAWNFGDGRTSEELSPLVGYDSVGTYTLSFTGFSTINQCPASASTTVEVGGLPELALMATDSSGCSPFTTSFSNTAANPGSLTYSWTFDDGANASNEATPNHTFEEPGTYVPRLQVTDAAGCQSDTFLSRIIVHPDPVPAFAPLNDRFCTGYDSLVLADSSTGATMLDWTIGGQSYGGTPPVVPFTTPGDITVNLIATNDFGCQADTSEVFSVLPSPEAMLAATPDSVCLDELSVLDASGSSPLTDLLWDLGDGTGRTSINFGHRYESAGAYDVSVIVSDVNGCPADTAYATVVVHPLPEAAFSLEESLRCGTPAPVQFTNASTGALSYDWIFGDGQSATTLNPEHVYTTEGLYQPRLIATTAFGCRDTAEAELVISGDPVANFALPEPISCSPYALSIEADPTAAIRYEWYINDAFSPSVGQRFDTVLAEPGSYDLTLIAIYDEVCRDTLRASNFLQLQPSPVAEFRFQEDELPNRLGDVHFTSESTGGTQLFWDLGDGTTNTAANFIHEYRINRDITVTHAVTETYGQGLVCSDTIRKEIEPEWITTFFVPTAISPESGPDEVRSWGAKGFGVAEYTLEVFSKWGQIVYSTSELEDSSPTGRWDGRKPDSDEFILQGAYTWRASVLYVNGVRDSFVGTVTVVR
ncbi:PKD domain-containing protein [Neolewinella aurantiaca]|uniref:PKD domain-containing protein n=1 Tax=Neolewinella aurantiaca TaxID=2602767 RepID=A0A5C7G0J6_9BACT|nr:PKD domain-containing protein [Neolewinella aurantiaca]TXF91235.1 PKD domain-containing protein [Neolewinella aurantiaca]